MIKIVARKVRKISAY